MSVIDDYLKDVEPAQKAALERVRVIVRQTVPDAEEVITYGMPGFKYKKKYLIAFAAFKDHLSVFPAAGPVEALRDELSGFEQTKGSVHFTVEHPVPDELIKELLTIRVNDINDPRAVGY